MRDEVYVGALFSEQYLAHYGVGHLQGGHSGRYPWGSGKDPKQHELKIRKNTTFTRYSDKKEKTVRNGSYMSYKKWDVDEYKLNALHGDLGNNTDAALYKIQIKSISPIRVATAKQVTEDVMKSIGNHKFLFIKWSTNAELEAKEAYKKLLDAGFYDESKNVNQRHDILYKKAFNTDIKNADHLRVNLAEQIHKVVYKDRDAFAKKYKDMGYDAITDPEDWAYIYEHPLIITNNNKFMIIGSEKIKNAKTIKHADESSVKTIEEIFGTFTDEQKSALYAYLVSSFSPKTSSNRLRRNGGKSIGDVFSTLDKEQMNVVDAIVGYAKTQKKYANAFKR